MSATLNPEPRTLTPHWSPTNDDDLIFHWVRMEGKTQEEVASMHGINQSTVSRIIQRYERWQAHLKDREGGRLDPHERLRAQRWITYERNERILASCLRIADKMEGFTELSKSTTSRPIHQPLEPREVRTEERVIDRHGVAARFLRLAYRINMDQLKLAENVAREQPPAAEPLSDEELAEELRQAAEDAAELAAARRRADEAVGWDKVAPATAGTPAPSTEDSVPSTSAQAASATQPAAPSTVVELRSPTATPNAFPIHHSPTHQAPTAPAAVHNLHNENPPQIAASTTQPCTCVLEVRVEKNAEPCIACTSTPARSVSEGPRSEPVQPAACATQAHLLVPAHAEP